jgi:hypothetical protein
VSGNDTTFSQSTAPDDHSTDLAIFNAASMPPRRVCATERHSVLPPKRAAARRGGHDPISACHRSAIKIAINDHLQKYLQIDIVNLETAPSAPGAGGE